MEVGSLNNVGLFRTADGCFLGSCTCSNKAAAGGVMSTMNKASVLVVGKNERQR